MIRPLTVRDAADIYLLNREQLGYDLTLPRTTEKLTALLTDTQHHFLLGFEDTATNQIVGYVHAEVYDTLYSDTLFNVLALAVAKSHEKQGIGKTLMTALEQEAINRNYEGIRLNSSVSRKEAHRFYEALNYDNNKEQKRFIKHVK
ncbi:GNAT family N-acetyltransferase [Vagococcus vulneris]|uniref:N-acetyltransferase domain-containing protein n=1 Tax=Vagococcus vulneris TaxID=1977869 RepID=A0A430A0D5_9ENTE|nr:GNAT family N-acetyltransferase [Vagococcus vulneris]RST99751.1 hypothetical protein CBF37_03230 [Vagococcus vulneris]